jgi:hypothetical protein
MAGEVDPGGERKRALAAFLEKKVSEGFQIETHANTHAIILQRSWSRLGRGGHRRYVVQVDDHGKVTMSAAEPERH